MSKTEREKEREREREKEREREAFSFLIVLWRFKIEFLIRELMTTARNTTLVIPGENGHCPSISFLKEQLLIAETAD
jgi:hypothetical protein